MQPFTPKGVENSFGVNGINSIPSRCPRWDWPQSFVVFGLITLTGNSTFNRLLLLIRIFRYHTTLNVMTAELDHNSRPSNILLIWIVNP
jgi:hypothetical protein